MKTGTKASVKKSIRNALLRIKEKIYRWITLKRYDRKYKIKEGQRYKHALLVAGTGAGKSEFLKTLVRQHIIYGKTALIILDANGDFAEQIARFKDNNIPFRKKDIVYVDATLSQEVFPIINPLDLPNVSTATLDKVVQQMHKTLLQSFKELEIKLTGAMDGMLYNMIHTLYRKEDSSLLDLVRFVDDNQNTDLVKLGSQTDNYVISDYFKNKFMNP